MSGWGWGWERAKLTKGSCEKEKYLSCELCVPIFSTGSAVSDKTKGRGKPPSTYMRLCEQSCAVPLPQRKTPPTVASAPTQLTQKLQFVLNTSYEVPSSYCYDNVSLFHGCRERSLFALSSGYTSCATNAKDHSASLWERFGLGWRGLLQALFIALREGLQQCKGYSTFVSFSYLV